MNTRDQTLVGDVQQGHAGGFVNTAALGFDDAVFDLVAHAQTMASTNAVGLQNQFDAVAKSFAVEGNGLTFFKTHGDLLALDFNIITPVGDAHDGLDDVHATGEALEVFRLVRGAQHVGVGRVGLLGRHLVVETGGLHEGRHLGTTT